MGCEEGTADLTTVGVGALSVEDFVVEVHVVDVHGTVESDGDHLGNGVWFQGTRDTGSVSGTETIGKDALGWVAVWGTVGIQINGASIFIGFVLAVGFTVAEKLFVNAFTISTGQFAFWADRLVGPQNRKNLTRFLYFTTIFNICFPVARLSRDVEC